jgi:glycosyltransferase involved in cell wall biosynthesis
MTHPPTISVLMPVYNADRYLAVAVESVLAQTFGDFEFIIVDDGSTDGSLAVLRRFEADDPRVRVVSRENRGLVASLNQMIGLARGEFLARMDADDLCLPDRFLRQVDFLRRNPDHIAVGCRALLIDPDGAPIRPFAEQTSHEEIDAAHLRGEGGAIVHPAAMIRRRGMEAIGGYDPGMWPSEDLDMFLRIAEHGRLANLPETLFQYRRHASATGYTASREQAEACRRAALAARRRRGLPAGDDATAAPGPAPHHYALWAWWALSAGNVGTARKYAFKTIRMAPASSESWRLAFCALRGR